MIKNTTKINESIKRSETQSTEHNWKRWLSSDDVAIILGVSKSTLSKMRMQSNSSTLPFSKIGGKIIRYDRLLVDKWLEEHQVQAGL